MPQSLAGRLFVLFAALQFGVLDLGLGLSYQYQLSQRIEDTRRTAELVTGVAAQAVAGSLANQDAAAIRPILRKAVESESFRSAAYIDSNGARIGFNATTDLFLPAPDWLRAHVAARLPGLDRGVWVAGRDAGVLRLEFAVDRIAAQLWESASTVLALAFAGLVAGLTLTRWLLRRWMGSLERFDQVATRIRAGATDATAEISADMPLEIRLAAEKLNSATASLRDQFGQRIDVLMDALLQHKGAVDQAAIVSELDPQGRILRVNDLFCVAAGRSRDEIIGRPWTFMRDDARPPGEMSALDAHPAVGDFCNRRPDGALFWVHSTRIPMFGSSGAVDKHICIDFDISERKASEERVHRLAYFDALTDLPNRRQFFEQVDERTRQDRPGANGCAVLHLDLYNFKDVNDTLGHAAGDELLVQVAGRLRACVGGADVVARVGGDEFAVLASAAAGVAEASALTERIFDALEVPILIRGVETHVSASVGVALCPEHGRDVTSLLRNADMALYRAKAQGKRGRQFFSSELERGNLERAEMERELRHALERGQLSLEYQPKYHLGFDKVVGAEALLRWDHPDLGRVSPVRFIPVAEQSQLIVPIGKWVIEEVCRQIQRWQQEGLPPVQVALNLSAVQFRSTRLFEEIGTILADAEIMPGQIELEITESLLMDDPDAAVTLLGRLRQAGFTIAIDDFGTGYSSLSYLRRFPVGVLKIDRSFIKDLAENMDDRAIASAVVGMAGSLLLDVVAEGVETIEQLDILRDMGCDYVQGYFIGKPMPARTFARFLRVATEHGIEVARVPQPDFETSAAEAAPSAPQAASLAASQG